MCDVAQPSCAELLGGPPEDPAERAVHPEELSVEREEGLPNRAVLEGGLELPVGGGHPDAARRVLPREEERHAEHVDRVPHGARVRRPDLREVDEDREDDRAQRRRRTNGDENRAGPVALPDRAGDEEAISHGSPHREINEGEGRAGRRADRQQTRAAPGQRHRSQLEDGSAQRHP